MRSRILFLAYLVATVGLITLVAIPISSQAAPDDVPKWQSSRPGNWRPNQAATTSLPS